MFLPLIPTKVSHREMGHFWKSFSPSPLFRIKRIDYPHEFLKNNDIDRYWISFRQLIGAQRVNDFMETITWTKIRTSKMGLIYIQMHFRLLLIMEANTMNPYQTAPKGAV